MMSFAAHRDWFWPRNDSDINTYGQLCWSNASLLAYLTKQARTALQKAPDANIISISQNDNGNYCQSPEEMAIITEEGTPGCVFCIKMVNVFYFKMMILAMENHDSSIENHDSSLENHDSSIENHDSSLENHDSL